MLKRFAFMTLGIILWGVSCIALAVLFFKGMPGQPTALKITETLASWLALTFLGYQTLWVRIGRKLGVWS